MDVGTVIAFRRQVEPKEGAFSILVPQGWQMAGGIFRTDPMVQGQSIQGIAAKLDFAVMQESSGRVMIRWWPEVMHCDMRFSPAGAMGMFPPGSMYQGMVAFPLMSAQDFLVQVVFPQAHPAASQAEVAEHRSLPKLVQTYQQRLEAFSIPGAGYDAAVVTFCYVEENIRYLEKAYTAIENLGPMAGGMWTNKDTLFLRAPEQDFERWEPILLHVQGSVQLNPQWIAQEVESQAWRNRMFLQAQQASIARDQKMLQVQRQVQDIDRQIVEHQQRTNFEIQNDAFLTLTEQEEYLNPYTQAVEVGTNQWDCRWVTESGDELYTDDGTFDPNVGDVLNRSDWKRSKVRPRFPD